MPTWRHTTLLGDAPARKMGFDWITQQLYHNTDRVLQACQFPAPSDPRRMLEDFTITTQPDDSFQYIWRHQDQVEIPIEIVTLLTRLAVLAYLSGAIWAPGTGTFMDHEVQNYMHRIVD